jgi:TRAP-type mannitol/chloroaromatic compound transport system permease small subunit
MAAGFICDDVIYSRHKKQVHHVDILCSTSFLIPNLMLISIILESIPICMLNELYQ